VSLGQLEFSTLFASANKHPTLNACQSKPNLSGWSVFGGIILCLNLGACAAPLMALGGSATTAASSAGSVVVSAAVANPSTAVSAVSTVTTGKSPLEHAASAATKQDCNFLNALGSKPICSDVRLPTIKDMSESYPGPADNIATSK
jgi:hypothetical protein